MITDPTLTAPALLHDFDPAQAVAVAVILQTCHDLYAGGYLRTQARRFMASDNFAVWCSASGFDVDHWRRLANMPRLRLAPGRMGELERLRAKRLRIRKQIAGGDLVKEAARVDQIEEIEKQIAAIVRGAEGGCKGEKIKLCQNRTKADSVN